MGWRCDVGDAKAQFESFLDSVMFITSTQLSGIDSINSRNDLMSQPVVSTQASAHNSLFPQTYSAAEKLNQGLLPEPSVAANYSLVKSRKRGKHCGNTAAHM